MKFPALGDLLKGSEEGNLLSLEEFLGGGSFGDVYKAIDTKTAEIYAVKFPRASSVGDSNAISAFKNEVQATLHINHENVVKVIYVELAHETLPPYLVMEFIDGGTLKDYLEKLRLQNMLVPSELIRKWSSDLIHGMHAINQKMLHRDLKPDNILISGRNLKISDFGLSKIVDALTRSNTFKGRQHMLYMAPEGWKNETNRIQLDMYALGIVLFEMATLNYPYDLPSNHDFRNPKLYQDMHLFTKAKSTSDFRTDLSPIFGQMIMKMLAKRPDDRFSNWEEVLELLKEAWDFEKSNNQEDQLIDSILDNVEQILNKQTSEQIQMDKERAEQIEKTGLDTFQWQYLINQLDDEVAKFNKRSSLGQIRKKEKQGSIIYVIPPTSQTIQVSSFPIIPEIHLERKNWRIRYVVYVREQQGQKRGFNFLLCRENDEDLYGKWVAYKMRQHPWLNRPPIPEPFGFSNNDEVQEHLRCLEGITGIYECELNENIQEEFLMFIKQITS